MKLITHLDLTAYHITGTRFIALGDKLNEVIVALNSREEDETYFISECCGSKTNTIILGGDKHINYECGKCHRVCLLRKDISSKEPTVKEECKCRCHKGMLRVNGKCDYCGCSSLL